MAARAQGVAGELERRQAEILGLEGGALVWGTRGAVFKSRLCLRPRLYIQDL